LTSKIFQKGEIEPEDFMRGDLLGFKTLGSKCTNHTAMWLGRNNWMVNSIQSMGVSDMEFNRAWNRCLTTVFRIMIKE
jgi:cell wall-associated NlpC family hydrolase